MIAWIVSSCILILAVILLRAAFRSKLKAWVRYSLWGLVLARLLIPFSFGSASFSAGSMVEEVKQRPAVQSVTQQLQKPNISYEQAYDQAVQDFLQSGQTVNPEAPLPDYTAPNYKPQTPLEQHTQEILEKNTPAVKLETALLWIWIGGMAVTAGCFLLSNLKFRRYLAKHRSLLDRHPAGLNIYTCAGLDTPCLFGLGKPAVYLLPEEAENEVRKQHVLCHELTHYCHGDHIWALLRCLCLILHWYNPLVWVAAILSQRDGELACDEATLKKLGEDQRHSYGVTLLEMTCARKPGAGLMNTATTMTGSKAAIKERVTMIARKPKVSMIALTLALLIAVVAIGFAFSGAADQYKIYNAQPSAELKAELEKAWAERGKEVNYNERYMFETATQFCDPKTKQDGIRYYGTYTRGMGETEVHILFIPCTGSDTNAQYCPDGKRFTHRTPFALLSCVVLTGLYPDLDERYYFFEPLSCEDEDILAKAQSLHEAYEKLFYGSVLTDVVYPDDENGLKEVETTWLALSGAKEDLEEYDLYDTCVYLGKHEDYLIIIPNLGYHADIESDITIGDHKFNCGHSFGLQGIKNGALTDLKELYDNGLISDAAIGKIEEKYYEIFPEYRDHFAEPEPEPTEPEPSTEPTEPENRKKLTEAELKQANAAMSFSSTVNPVIKKFFTSYYDTPEDIDLSSFVIGFPTAEDLTDEAEYAKLRQLPDFPCPNAATLAQCPTTFRKVKGADIDAALQKYAGISLKETNMRWDSFIDPLLYLEEYDAFYYDATNWDSGGFYSTSGWVEEDTAVLYKDLTDKFLMVTFKNIDGNWMIVSNQLYDTSLISISIDPEGAIKTPTVMVNAWLYEYTGSSYRHASMPKEYKQIGQVVAQDNNNLPTQEFHGAQLPVGAEIYTNPKNNSVDIIIKLADGSIHTFIRSKATQPTLEGEKLAFFQELLQNSYWHNCIAGHTFEAPEKASIYAIFSSGMPEKPDLTDAEKRFLREETNYDGNTECNKIPAATMEQVLQQYLGISLAQSEKDGIDSFRYYSGTDVYFSFNNGFEGLGGDFQVYFVQEVDGCYEVFYNRDGRYKITLQLVDGVFRILSNVAI